MYISGFCSIRNEQFLVKKSSIPECNWLPPYQCFSGHTLPGKLVLSFIKPYLGKILEIFSSSVPCTKIIMEAS